METGLVDRVQFTDELLRRLGSRDSSEHLDDVTELAIIRASPGVLQSHGVIEVHVNKVEPRYRGQGYIRFPLVPIDFLWDTVFQIIQENRKSQLRFIQDEMIHPLDLFIQRDGIRSARHHRLARSIAQLNDFFE
jgi:hypothetical protein